MAEHPGAGDDVQMVIEAGRSAGAHADLRFVLPGAMEGRSIEVKALGLSDEEAEFCVRVQPMLEKFVPSAGFPDLHITLDAPAMDIPRPNDAERYAPGSE